jgi:hypothetical protein
MVIRLERWPNGSRLQTVVHILGKRVEMYPVAEVILEIPDGTEEDIKKLKDHKFVVEKVV